MHICFIAIDYHAETGGGGIASYVETLAEELIKQGHRVTALIRGKGEPFYKQGIRIVPVPLGNVHWYLYKFRIFSFAILPVRELEWSIAIRKAVDKLMREDPVDLVEAAETGYLFL